MNDLCYALLLTFFECTFVFAALSLLYFKRNAIGKAPFYMSCGLLLLFAGFLGAADCRIRFPGSLDFELAGLLLVLPVLTAYLMVYITEGTLHAQRMIIGVIVLGGIFFYIGELAKLECSWHGFSIISGIDGATLGSLLAQSRRKMMMSIIITVSEMFVLPIVYTKLSNFKINRIASVWLAMMTAMLCGELLRWGQFFALHIPFDVFGGDAVAHLITRTWMAVLLAGYLNKIELDIRTGEKSPLDIVFAFIGGYGRSKELERNLRDWTGRYKLILEHADELIVMMNRSGVIIDANPAAAVVLGAQSCDELTGMRLFQRLTLCDGSVVPELDRLTEPVHFRCILNKSVPGGEKQLRCSLSPVINAGQLLLVLIAGDITEEMRLTEEKTKLSEQLIHSQRIESLGQLAGGIAHDFNNHIHAIMGHVDVINYMHRPSDPEAVRHLEKITAIAEQAGKLTGQLLGFARKGKYHVEKLSPADIISASLELVNPRKHQDVEVYSDVPDTLPPVLADRFQMQQVLLNLMLNALDALSEKTDSRRLEVSACRSGDLQSALVPPPEISAESARNDFICFIVADNGCGMDKATRDRIFEPFFTTKPVGRGTGMGLSMVYGAVSNHHGWIQVESEPGLGTRFLVFLPSSCE